MWELSNIPVVTAGALHGLLESLDANSSYLSAAEYAEYKSHQSSAKAELSEPPFPSDSATLP